MLESLFTKFAGLRGKKEAPTQVFSCEHCEILKNTCFEKHLRMVASDHNAPGTTNIYRKNEDMFCVIVMVRFILLTRSSILLLPDFILSFNI